MFGTQAKCFKTFVERMLACFGRDRCGNLGWSSSLFLAGAKVQGRTRGERIRPFYPRICATEGLKKKMGWVGESLLSAGVIAPGVGARFLSTGICRARTQRESGCTLVSNPSLAIRSTRGEERIAGKREGTIKNYS